VSFCAFGDVAFVTSAASGIGQTIGLAEGDTDVLLFDMGARANGLTETRLAIEVLSHKGIALRVRQHCLDVWPHRHLIQAHYNTAKAGVIHLSKSQAKEWVTAA